MAKKWTINLNVTGEAIEEDIAEPTLPPIVIEDVYTPTIFTIPLTTGVVDGFTSPWNQIQPGDIIELAPGTRGNLAIRNLSGTKERPITIRNGNGQVVMDTTASWFGFWFRNLHYIHFTGSGYGQEYGIRVARCVGFGIFGEYRTDNIEIDHVQIERVSGVGFGIHIITKATTSPDYDYNGNGVIDSVDNINNRELYTLENIYCHHNLFDGGENIYGIDMAYYVGISNYCETPNEPASRNIRISHNICRNIASKVIQVGSVISNLDVHNNYIINGCMNDSDNQDIQGININAGIGGRVFDNKIFNTRGRGITYQSAGGYIYNNLIVNCGAAGTYWDDGITIDYRRGYSHNNNTYVLNNTIINPVGYGIEFADPQMGIANYIQNNIIVQPNGRYLLNAAGRNFVISHNIQEISLALAGLSEDYYLLSTSPAINRGVEVSYFGIDKDLDGNSRLQNVSSDIGCYEFNENN